MADSLSPKDITRICAALEEAVKHEVMRRADDLAEEVWKRLEKHVERHVDKLFYHGLRTSVGIQIDGAIKAAWTKVEGAPKA